MYGSENNSTQRLSTTVVEEREPRKPAKFEASPISSLSRPQTRRHGETRILFTIHTLHAHLLDSHFMLFALNCSLRSRVGWVCFHRLEQRTSRDAMFVDTFRHAYKDMPRTFSILLLSFVCSISIFPLFSLKISESGMFTKKSF